MAHDHRGPDCITPSLPSLLALGEALLLAGGQSCEVGRAGPRGRISILSQQLAEPQSSRGCEYLAPNMTVTTGGYPSRHCHHHGAWTLYSSHESSHSGSFPSSHLQGCKSHLSYVLVFMETHPLTKTRPEKMNVVCCSLPSQPTILPIPTPSSSTFLPFLRLSRPPLCSGPHPSCSLKDIAPVTLS